MRSSLRIRENASERELTLKKWVFHPIVVRLNMLNSIRHEHNFVAHLLISVLVTRRMEGR